jgi:hypothetical protein
MTANDRKKREVGALKTELDLIGATNALREARAEVGVLREALQAAQTEAAAFQKVYWEDGRRWEDERAGRIKAESVNVALREALTALLAATDEWGQYAPCPCGAWIAGHDERPHVIGCEIGAARAAAAAVVEQP